MRSALLLAALLAATPVAAQQITEQQLLGPVEFRGLHAVSKEVVWASGSEGWVYHTTTGGEHWTIDTIPGASAYFLVDIWAADSLTAFVAGTKFSGGAAAIFVTKDGGRTWSRPWALERAEVFLDGIGCWDRTHCLALGDPMDGAYFLLTTDDGGATWQRISPLQLPPSLEKEGAFAASGTSLAMGPNGEAMFGTGGGPHARIFSTKDRGITWTVTETPLPAGTSAGIFGLTYLPWPVAVGGDYQLPADSAPNVLIRLPFGDRRPSHWQLEGRTTPIGVKWGLTGMMPNTFLATAPTGTSIGSMTRDQGLAWRVLDTKPANTASCAGGVCWLAGKNRLAKVTF